MCTVAIQKNEITNTTIYYQKKNTTLHNQQTILAGFAQLCGADFFAAGKKPQKCIFPVKVVNLMTKIIFLPTNFGGKFMVLIGCAEH